MTVPELPSLRDRIAWYIDEYRAKVTTASSDDPAGFIRWAHADPGNIGGEVVDYASDQLGAEIDYDWETPHELRDALYAAATDWARALTEAGLKRRLRPADLPADVLA